MHVGSPAALTSSMRQPRIIPATDASPKAKHLLDAVQAKLGVTPNLMKTLAHSPAALGAYLAFSGTLAAGALDTAFQEQIAITVAQVNSCEYCLSAHSFLGTGAGLTAEEIGRSREAHSLDPKRDAGLRFAQKIVVQRGEVSDSDLAAVRQAGYSEGEITEIVAHVGLNIFTNYFNIIARTEVDFPLVPLAMVPA